MPVEPTSANFRKFEVDNKHIHLNVYGTLGDEARSPVTHHCMSATTKTSVPRQSTSCSQEMRKGKGHYSFIRNMSRLMHSTTKSGKKKQVCPHCVDAYFHSQRALNNHLKERHPHLFHEHVCERCLNVFNTLLRSLSSTRNSVCCEGQQHKTSHLPIHKQ